MSSQSVTFVTIGKLAGKTINIGPAGKFRFVDGEMSVPEEESSLVGKALRFYSAFPKGDARPFHVAACKKLGIDPDTLKPLGGETAAAVPKPAPKVPQEIPPMAKSSSTGTEDARAAVRKFVESMDNSNPLCWTGAGKPSIGWVKNEMDQRYAEYVTRELLDDLNVVRSQPAKA